MDFVKYGLVPMNYFKVICVHFEADHFPYFVKVVLDKTRSRDRSLSMPTSESPKHQIMMKKRLAHDESQERL